MTVLITLNDLRREYQLIFSMIAEKHYEDNKARDNQPVGTPMHRLLRDPYIAIVAGALVGEYYFSSFALDTI